jgi:26S proteasome regulatory subunit T5
LHKNNFQESLGEEVLRMATDEVIGRTRLLDNEIKIMKSEVMRISHELQAQNDKIKDNAEKIKVNKTLPYLVSNVIEVCYGYKYQMVRCLIIAFVLYQLLDVDPQDMGEEDGAVVDLDAQRKGKCAVIKTSTRQVSNKVNLTLKIIGSTY